MNFIKMLLPTVICAVGLLSCGSESKSEVKSEAEVKKPNIIYILADDMGYGDVSCYGAKKFETPSIDRLAAQGMKFTQHYSGSTVCAPSRSALLTGQHTGHTQIRGNREIMPEGQEPLSDSAYTIAELLKDAGYTTGAFGKWGLGFPGSEGDPVKQGFDQFYGYNCQRMAHRYYPSHIWHNLDKVVLEGNDWEHTAVYAQDLIQDKTLEFIEDNKDKPFFAFVPIVLPHAELISPQDSILKRFEGVYGEEKPYVGGKGADYNKDLTVWGYCSQEQPHAVFASMVVRTDTYVGQIMDKVKELGIDDNTIIIFTSDNGPHQEGGADPDFFNSNGPFKGYKRDLYEGGIRVPFIVSWPGKIANNSVSNHISAFWDMMPTVADIAGVDTPKGLDGISFLPELLGDKSQKKHPYLYWEFHEKGGRIAVRMGKWKGVVYNALDKSKTTFQLFDLTDDLGEENDLSAQYPEVVKQIKDIMKNSRTESDIYKFASKTL